ncbi:MAG: family 16 glycosylhydrolase [Bacteroidota bacterium]
MSNNTLFSLFFLVLWLSSCTESTTTTQPETAQSAEVSTNADTLTIETEDYTGATEGVRPDAEGVIVVPGKDSWLEFEINVPVAGRYQFDIRASALTDTAEVWVEDYVGNKDGRTYNITGSVPIPKNNQLQNAGVDGSPMNKGTHKIRVHFSGGFVKVDWVKFILLKAHQVTPELLTQKTDGEEWSVVWADEFEGEGIPDTSKWTFDIGNWGWGNNELQYYTENRTENARQENGLLIIEARKNDMGQKWTSARLTTRGKVTFQYGRIEFRAKVPTNRGNWAAGWTLGDDYVDELSWPYCGEIDILESVGYEIDDATGDGKAHASIHCGAYYFKLGNQPTADVPVQNMNNEFHIYAVDWTPEGIIASVDGKEYFTYNDTATDLAWPFSKAQNIILNLAMGGGWGGLKGMDETMTSQQFLVDYVRVYEKK